MPASSLHKTLVIGWDGATPELVEPWMEAGHLPHLKALVDRGAYGRLRSVTHPLSPQAWASCVTGLNPGRHGLFDFGHRVPGTYEMELLTSLDRSGMPLWGRVDEAGGTSVVVNVPISYPPESLRGAMVTGMHTPSLPRGLFPPSLWEQVRRVVPDYRLDVMSFDYQGYDEFLAEIHRSVDARARLATYLWERFHPDLFFVVFTATDRVQHALWKQSCLPGEGQERGTWRYAHAIREVYQQLDAVLGDFVAMAGEEARVIVLSDHGFGSLDRDVYLNAALEDAGLLTVKRSFTPAGRLQEMARRLRARAGGCPWCSAEVAALDDSPRPSFGHIDWGRTRAYSAGLFGGVYLNLRGREPLGTVASGPEADHILAQVEKELSRLRDPDDGLPVVDKMQKREVLYHGPRAGESPDMVVTMRNYRYMTRAGREIGRPGELVVMPAVNHSGNHRLDGIVALGGPGIAGGTALPSPHLLDIAPTALACMGIPVPEDLDGRPLTRAFDGLSWRYAAPGEVASSDQASRASSQPHVPSFRPGEEEEVLKRMEGLGYLA